MNLNIVKIKEKDLNLILKWRNQKIVRNFFFNKDIIKKNEHLNWWSKAKKDKTKKIFIIEINKKKIGIIQIYDYDKNNSFCFWSAHIGHNTISEKKNNFEIWCKIEEKVINYVEKNLKCKYLFCETLSSNTFVLEIHRRYDFKPAVKKDLKLINRKYQENITILKKKLSPPNNYNILVLSNSNWEIYTKNIKKIFKHFLKKEPKINFYQYGNEENLILNEKPIFFDRHDLILCLFQIEDFLENPFLKFDITQSKILISKLKQKLLLLTKLFKKTQKPIYILDLSYTKKYFTQFYESEINDLTKLINLLNNLILKHVNNFKNVEVINSRKIVLDVGVNNIDSEKYFNIGRIPYKNVFVEKVINNIVHRENLKKINKSKVLVVDLDNTLWGGILGELGEENIDLNYDFPGNIYIQIQSVIKYLSKRGLLLAIVSKNDHSHVMKVFKKNGYMVLKKNDFVNFKINWTDKSKNIIEIAKELNLDLNSFSFLDDSPYERNSIKKQLPQVDVIEWPKDIFDLPKILIEYPKFNSGVITREDKSRKTFYQSLSKINSLKLSSKNKDDFIEDLKMNIFIKNERGVLNPRIIQLIERTTQFNSYPKTYDNNLIYDLIQNGNKLYSVSVDDKFSKKEIVSSFVLDENKDFIIIKIIVFSCRFLGRKVEDVIFNFILLKAKKLNKGVKILYKKTDRNKLFREHMKAINLNKKTNYFYKDFNKLNEVIISIPKLNSYNTNE